MQCGHLLRLTKLLVVKRHVVGCCRTSDEHISIAQFLKASHVDGAIIVTTPQEVSIIDVRKEINFCKKVQQPLLWQSSCFWTHCTAVALSTKLNPVAVYCPLMFSCWRSVCSGADTNM